MALHVKTQMVWTREKRVLSVMRLDGRQGCFAMESSVASCLGKCSSTRGLASGRARASTCVSVRGRPSDWIGVTC